jgi:hypothetical protein
METAMVCLAVQRGRCRPESAVPSDVEIYGPTNVLNTLELPVNLAARPNYPPGIVSSSVWCASPAGLKNGVGGALTTAMPDATIAERQACAAAAQPLP